MNRRAQVTLFVIIGIVLLLVAFLFIMIRRFIIPVDPHITTHDFSGAIATYQSGAEQCLDYEGARAFKEIMANGGYIDPGAEGFHAMEEMPTKGSGVLMGDKIIPYWLEHKGTLGCRGSCSFVMHNPPLTAIEGNGKSIEERAEEVMLPRIGNCMDSLSLTDDYELSVAEPESIDIIISSGSVRYDLRIEANITFIPSDATTTLESVSGESEANVKQLYDAGLALIQQLETSNVTTSMGDAIALVIQTYGMGEDPVIPPMYGAPSFTLRNQDMWFYPEVKEHLQRLFEDNLQLVQLRGTPGDRLFLEQNRYSDMLYNAGVFTPNIYWPDANFAQNQLNGRFFYDSDWDIELDISPSNGFIIKPHGSDFNILESIGIGLYDSSFGYDVRLPMVVVLSDYSSFNGQGLSLVFAFETGLAGNEPILYGDGFTIEEVGVGLFGSDEQRLRDVVTVTAKNELTGASLEGVDVTYVCGRDATDVGTTGPEGFVENGLPMCLGGYLVGSLDGYLGSVTRFDWIEGESAAVEVGLTPFKEFSVQLESYLLSRYIIPPQMVEDDELPDDLRQLLYHYGELGLYDDEIKDKFLGDYRIEPFYWNLAISSARLDVDDKVLVILTRESVQGEDEYVAISYINFSNEHEKTLKLAAGKYDVQIYLTKFFEDGEEFVIPERDVCWGEGWFDGPAGCDTLNETVFNESMISGGVELLVDDGFGLEITAESYAGDTVLLPFIKIKIDDMFLHEDLAVLGEIDGYSLVHDETLRPSVIE